MESSRGAEPANKQHLCHSVPVCAQQDSCGENRQLPLPACSNQGPAPAAGDLPAVPRGMGESCCPEGPNCPGAKAALATGPHLAPAGYNCLHPRGHSLALQGAALQCKAGVQAVRGRWGSMSSEQCRLADGSRSCRRQRLTPRW